MHFYPLERNNPLMKHLQIPHLSEHDGNFLQNHQKNYKYFDCMMNFFHKLYLMLNKAYLNVKNFEKYCVE